jgi:cytosine/adenosine deaminase-related metal-dependent hydrolase
VCHICELAASEVGAGAGSRLAAFAVEPGLWRAAPVNLEAAHGAAASAMPEGVGVQGRRLLIKGGTVLSMDERVGNHAVGDVLIDGSRIAEVAASIHAPDAAVIDASGHIVMPGFIDAHSHQFETALRSFLADGILINDGRPESAHNYYESILQKLSMGYRPQDVYINELFAGVAQIDAGVTAVMDISQIHHSPEHSDAAIAGLRAAGRRAVFGYFEGWGEKTKYPGDARRLREQHFSSSDQLLSMFMGGEIYLPGYEEAWKVGRELNLPIAAHIVGTFGMQPTFDALATAGKFSADCFFIHMTGMSEVGWKAAADAGAHVTFAVPIEMQMRHGTPPIQKALDLRMSLSLSTDVECTMTADMFTQMRGVMTLQRMLANELALQGKEYPKLMSVWDALELATMGGAKGLKIEAKTGSLTPGKDADIIFLDATALNVAPLNHAAGAVVTLMERSNVSTVLCAGQIKKWRGGTVGYDIPRLRAELDASRDYVFAAAGIERDLFRA